MTERDRFPLYLPEELKDEEDSWIGQKDSVQPELWITGGPTSEELLEAFKEKAKIKLSVESRTARMHAKTPNHKLGNIEVTIQNLYKGSREEFHFLATGENIPFSDGRIWVWNYKNRYGAADVPEKEE